MFKTLLGWWRAIRNQRPVRYEPHFELTAIAKHPYQEWKGIHMYYPNVDSNRIQKDPKDQEALINKTAICLSKGSNFKKRGKIRSLQVSKNTVMLKDNDGEEFSVNLDNLYIFSTTKEELEAEETEITEHLQEIMEKRAFLEESKVEELDLDRFDAKRIVGRIKSSPNPEEEVLKLITRRL